MAERINCWEFKKCGREPGGTRVNEFGICPAATETAANGINGGINGGRICWAIAGTFYDGKIQGIYAGKMFSCTNCDFFELVDKEEKIGNYEILTPVQLSQFLASRSKKVSPTWRKESQSGL